MVHKYLKDTRLIVEELHKQQYEKYNAEKKHKTIFFLELPRPIYHDNLDTTQLHCFYRLNHLGFEE